MEVVAHEARGHEQCHGDGEGDHGDPLLAGRDRERSPGEKRRHAAEARREAAGPATVGGEVVQGGAASREDAAQATARADVGRGADGVHGRDAARAQGGREGAREQRDRREPDGEREVGGRHDQAHRGRLPQHRRPAVGRDGKGDGCPAHAEREPQRDAHEPEDTGLREDGPSQLAARRAERREQAELARALGDGDGEGARYERDGGNHDHDGEHRGDLRERVDDGAAAVEALIDEKGRVVAPRVDAGGGDGVANLARALIADGREVRGAGDLSGGGRGGLVVADEGGAARLVVRLDEADHGVGARLAHVGERLAVHQRGAGVPTVRRVRSVMALPERERDRGAHLERAGGDGARLDSGDLGGAGGELGPLKIRGQRDLPRALGEAPLGHGGPWDDGVLVVAGGARGAGLLLGQGEDAEVRAVVLGALGAERGGPEVAAQREAVEVLARCGAQLVDLLVVLVGEAGLPDAAGGARLGYERRAQARHAHEHRGEQSRGQRDAHHGHGGPHAVGRQRAQRVPHEHGVIQKGPAPN